MKKKKKSECFVFYCQNFENRLTNILRIKIYLYIIYEFPYKVNNQISIFKKFYLIISI